jgi:hypothetical protein
LGKWGAGRKAQ